MFGNGGIFCMYSYVSPLMIRVAGFSPEAMTLVILLAGLGMFVGNLVSGGLSDRYTPERVARFAQGIAVVAVMMLINLVFRRYCERLPILKNRAVAQMLQVYALICIIVALVSINQIPLDLLALAP